MKFAWNKVPRSGSTSRGNIYLWGVSEESILTGVVASKRFRSQVYLVNIEGYAALEEIEKLGFNLVAPEELPTDAHLLASRSLPVDATIRAEYILLEHGASGFLQQELRAHSALELLHIGQKMRQLGLMNAATYIHHSIYYIYNCRLPLELVIGEGSSLAYGGIGVVINKSSRIGSNVKIGQNVTLGAKAGGYGPPIIGDNVFIGPNAVCIGGPIGENSVIGAGSIVTKPIDANSIVAGNPARVIRKIEG